jgi:hypothetical protein
MESFERKLQALLNSCSKENDSDTPDYILAEYLGYCLDAFNYATKRRDTHFGQCPRLQIKEELKFQPKTQAQTMVAGMQSMEDVLKKVRQETNPWKNADTDLPPLGKKIELKLSNGEIRIGKYDKDENRTCWLIQGTGGLFWRSMLKTVECWRDVNN